MVHSDGTRRMAHSDGTCVMAAMAHSDGTGHTQPASGRTHWKGLGVEAIRAIGGACIVHCIQGGRVVLVNVLKILLLLVVIWVWYLGRDYKYEVRRKESH